MEIILSYPFWYILFCLLAGGLYAYGLYNKPVALAESSGRLLKTLAVFRFLVISVLAFFLLSPFIKSSLREIEKPIMVIAVDNSQSIRNDSARIAPVIITDAVQKLRESLSGSYNVKTFAFGEGMEEKNAFSFSGKLTNIANVFDEVKTRYEGSNLGSVILISDGIYNTGSNPVYKAENLKVPIFTVALGDTTVNKDVILAHVNHNRVAYLGNTFPLEIKMNARQASGENSILTVTEDSSVLFSRNISISGSAFYLSVPVFIEAKQKGLHHYKIMLSAVKEEKNLLNNSTDIYVEVLESRQKVLILANAPHPDIAALQSLLEKSNNYEVKVAGSDNFTSNVKENNLVVLYQIPSSRTSGDLMQKIKQAGVPVLYGVGSQTNISAFNALQTGVTISQSLNKMNEVFPEINESFSLFTFQENLGKALSSFPPLYVPFGTYQTTGEIYTLFTQKIGAVATSQPLLYFKEDNGLRHGVLLGEGFWKWRLREYADHNNTSTTDELFTKIVQYLVVKDKLSPFRIHYKTSVSENEPLLFDAELYNNAGELLNEPEVRLNILSADKKEYRYTFSRVNKTYHLNAGNFPPGKYSFKGETKLGDKIFYDQGEFSVSRLLVENTETTANHPMLYSLAKNSGGLMVSIDETDKIVNAINSMSTIKPVSYYHKKLTELISVKWVLAVLITLLSLEWFLRKRNGAY